MRPIKDLSNQRFGRLTALEFHGYGTSNKVLWKCICDCGNTSIVKTNNLTTGKTKSCGCLNHEANPNQIQKVTKHGHTSNQKASKTYSSWRAMMGRCNNKNHTDYSFYGAKGITVCLRWNNFENFLEDMGERPTNTTLDRINGTLGYFKENCRWATPAQQSQNLSSNKFTKELIEKIRNDPRTQSAIARDYNTSQGHISRIKGNKVWN